MRLKVCRQRHETDSSMLGWFSQSTPTPSEHKTWIKRSLSGALWSNHPSLTLPGINSSRINFATKGTNKLIGQERARYSLHVALCYNYFV